MTEQHVPGPWHVYRGRDLDNVWRKGRTVAAYPQGDAEYGDMAIAYCDYATPEIAEANARLIAAAPDMLAALERVARHGTLFTDDRKAVLAAIAKAGGKGDYCPFCKKHHEGGDTCMGHHP